MAEDAAAPVTELRDDEIEISDNWDEITPSFDGLGLTEDLLRGIYAYGFERPSAIQQRAIKPVLMGRDVIAQAQSGTLESFIPYLPYSNTRPSRGLITLQNTIFRG